VLLESTTLQTAIEEGKLSMDPENPLPLEETLRRSEEFSSEEESS